MNNSFKIKKGQNIEPTLLAPTVKGDLTVDSTSGDMRYHNGSGVSSVSTEINTQTFQNKTISGNDNTLTDVPVSALDPLTANKALATNGSGQITPSTTTDVELGYVSGVTSSIQSQLNAKQPSGNYVIDPANNITFVEQSSAPATPSTGRDVVYFKTDGKIYKKNDAGVESILSGGSGLESVCIYVDATLGSNTSGEGGSVTPYQTITYALSQITNNNVQSYTLCIQGDFTGEGTVTTKKNVSFLGLGDQHSNLVNLNVAGGTENFDSYQSYSNIKGTINFDYSADTNNNIIIFNNCEITGGAHAGNPSSGSLKVVENNCRVLSVPTCTNITTFQILNSEYTASGLGNSITISGLSTVTILNSKFVAKINTTANGGNSPVVSLDKESSYNGIQGTATLTVLDERYATFNTNTTFAASGSSASVFGGDASGGNRTFQIPTASLYIGKSITVKKIDSSANTVTIFPTTGTIDGNVTIVLSSLNDSITMISDGGSDWKIISSTLASSGSGVPNYIKNPSGKTNTNGWVAYANAASNIPVNGSGGSPGVFGIFQSAFPTVSATSDALFLGPAGGSGVQQGKGVSYDFSVSKEDLGKVLNVSFDYMFPNLPSLFAADGITPPLQDGTTSVNTGNSTFEVFIYDITGAKLIPVSPNVLTGGKIYASPTGAASVTTTFSGTFQTDAVNADYRLIIHVARPESINNGSGLYFAQVNVSKVQTIQASQTIAAFVNDASGQSLPVGQTVIKHTVKETDTYGAYNSTTGEYIVPVSGIYNITGALEVTGAPSNGQLIIVVNNVDITLSAVSSALYHVISTNGLSLKAGDVVSLSFFTGTSTSVSSDPRTNYFSLTCINPVEITAQGIAAASAIGNTFTVATPNPFNPNTIIYDSMGAYNSSTGVYTVPVSGYYTVNIGLAISFPSSGGTLALYKNGSNQKYILSMHTADGYKSGSADCYAVAGDQLTIVGDTSVDVANMYIDIKQTPSLSVNSETSVIISDYGIGPLQTIPSTAFTTIDFQDKVLDSAAAMDSGVFTCPQSGEYMAMAHIRFNANNSGERALDLYKNGSFYRRLGEDASPTSGNFSGMGGQTPVRLIAGDTLDFRAYQSSGGGLDLTDSGYTYCSIYKIK